jgi:hypothetical protein
MNMALSSATARRTISTLFLLAFNIIGFAEGYLMREMGLLWLPAPYPRHGYWSCTAQSAAFMIA